MKRLIILMIIFLSITSSAVIPNIISKPVENFENNQDVNCYGFIVNTIKHEDVVFQTETNCRIHNMINDLLRENITIYRASINFLVSIFEIGNNKKSQMNFDQGTFIIPFSKDEFTNKKIISIIFNYNQTSFIEKEEKQIPIYILADNLGIEVLKINEPKIACYRNKINTGEMNYLEISTNYGFLNLDFLNEEMLKDELNSNKYNVLVRIGHCPLYSDLYTFYYTILEDVKFKVSRSIRDFVSNGGGYIGSCLGAEEASSGMMLGKIPLYFKRRAYNPKMNLIGLTGISDVIVKIGNKALGKTEVAIVNRSHPVTYGIDTFLDDYHFSGPKFMYVGENSQVIARFNEEGNSLYGYPSWISSKFGEGKAVIYSTHPEVVCWHPIQKNYSNKMVVPNSLYYVTSKDYKLINTELSKNLSFLGSIFNKLKNIEITNNKNQNFINETKEKIINTIDDFKKLNNTHNQVCKKIEEIAEEKGIKLNKNSKYLGYYSLTFRHYVHRHFEFYIRYLNNTIKVLDTFEKVFDNLNTDINFLKNFSILRNFILEKVNETQLIIEKCKKEYSEYSESLEKYSTSKLFLNIQKIKNERLSLNLYQTRSLGYYHIPQMYYESLKFLRNSWYEYETSVVD
jgi:hypothetical protein